MGKFIEIPGLGETYLPTAWIDAVGEEETPKRFAASEKSSLNALLKHLRLDGSVLLSGSWDDAKRLLGVLETRKKELLPYSSDRKPERERGREFWEETYRLLLARLLLTASSDGHLDTEPPLRVPYLLEFLGDARTLSQGRPLLVPVLAVRRLLDALDPVYTVNGLPETLVAPESVLQPRQQEVYELLQEALLQIRPQLPTGCAALDMGCGSGALTLLLATLLAERGVHVTATDTLPEALATTRLNVERFIGLGHVASGVIEITDGGDLYAPLGDRRFDLIAFNPPWATAPARTRLEVARFDPGQRTLRRFLAATPEHLTERGRLLLFYADNAGRQVIENLETYVGEAGLRIAETFYRRIRVTRKWENIYLYDLTC